MIERLLSYLRRSEEEDEPIDHYEIRYRGFDERGWHRLDSLDIETKLVPESETPLARDRIEPALSGDGLPDGVYKLYPIREDGTMAEPRWTIEFESGNL